MPDAELKLLPEPVPPQRGMCWRQIGFLLRVGSAAHLDLHVEMMATDPDAVCRARQVLEVGPSSKIIWRLIYLDRSTIKGVWTACASRAGRHWTIPTTAAAALWPLPTRARDRKHATELRQKLPASTLAPLTSEEQRASSSFCETDFAGY